MIASETTLTAADLPDSLDRLMPLVMQRIPAGVGKGHAQPVGQDALAALGRPRTELTAKQERTAAEQFGTLGSGNHFVEVCLDERDLVWMVLHSGSRGIGNQLAQRAISEAKGLMKQRFIELEDPDLAYLVQGEPSFDTYIADMLWAQAYAMGSRAVMAERLLASLFEVVGTGRAVRTINCHHNFTQLEHHGGKDLWITRKGAIKAGRGDEGVIPGSMGTRSYVVTGLGSTASYSVLLARRRPPDVAYGRPQAADRRQPARGDGGPLVERRRSAGAARRAPGVVQGHRPGDGRPDGPGGGAAHAAPGLQLQGGVTMTDDEQAARDFAAAFAGLLSWVGQHEHGERRGNEVVELVRGHLGEEGRSRSVVSRERPLFEQVNLQVALDAWLARPGRTVVVHGIALPQHYGPIGLQELISGDGLPPVRLSAPDLADLPAGPERTVACWRTAVLLVEDEHGRSVMFVRGAHPHGEPVLLLEVAGLETADAQEVQRELSDLAHQLNVYRGQVLELVQGQGGLTIAFPVLPETARGDVVLPEQVLRRIERHTVDIAARRDDLRAAGQHLKRGLLLYGPPGTGKTHTTRYVVQQLRGATVLMLSGQALHLIGMVSQLARDLQPAVVVLEDVDLVAEDRGFGSGTNPVLFELLDAMDGAAADADLLFLLTTNRADLLEPALAARPGRVDVAVEVGLPDADARRRLFGVYSRGVPLEVDEAAVDEVVERTDGVTASFIKELLRRAVLESLTEHEGPLRSVTGAHLSRALDDLLDSTQSVTRALLGVPSDQSGVPASAPMGPVPGMVHGGMWATGAYSSAFEVSYDD